MEKEFSLEAILTSTTGITCVNDFDDFFELVWFVYGTDGIGPVGLTMVAEDLRNHLLSLYPELGEVQKPTCKRDLPTWLQEQKNRFGNTLTVCPMGQKLSAQDETTKQAHI